MGIEKKIKIVIFDIVITNSQIGLAYLQCEYITIANALFVGIEFYQIFIHAIQTTQFLLRSTTFKNFILNNNPLIKLDESCNLVHICESTIKNMQLIVTLKNQNLIEISNNDKFYFNYNYVFNNSCIRDENIGCHIISLTQDDDGRIISFLDALFQSNQFTKILDYHSISGNDILRQDQPSNINFSGQIYLDVIIFYQNILNYQENFASDYKNIKLNINNYYLVESLINLKYKLINKEININNNPKDQVVYLPSGQILNQYKILEGLTSKQYINKFVFEMMDPNKINCSLDLIESFDDLEAISQSQSIQINQDYSHILQFKIDPYNRQTKYSLKLICHNGYIIQKIQYKIKSLPCQKGEYYNNQQCNLCNIYYWQNTLQKNSNKCDYFDQNVVSEMKQGLIKLKFGYWRPNYHVKDFSLCESSKCQGGWQVGDSSCVNGSSGALCQECDIYNKRGNGSYSKLQDQQCAPCLTNKNYLIIYVIIIFCYQLIQTYLASNKSQQFISNYIIQIQNRQYNILQGLQIDQISINFKILQDVFVKLILFNQLKFIIPDIISVSLNLIPTELVNKGLYCNFFLLGPNILLLQLICIFAFTLFLIQICTVIYVLLVISKTINYTITYITTIFQYGYKQSFINISHLLLTQLIYVVISNEFYLIGNQQYQYKYYKHITFKVILPIYLLYSIFIPIVIIIILAQTQRKDLKFYKLWAFYIQNYNSKFQFWDLYQLLQYSILQFIYFFFYQQKHNQFTFFCVAIFFDLILQKHIKVYNLNKLNVIQYDTQLKILAVQTFLQYYYQIQSEYISLCFFGFILILVYNIIKPLISNILKRIIVQYVHYTISYQDKIIKRQIYFIIIRFPKFVFIQKRFNFNQNPARAKFNFQKLIKLVRNQKSESSRNNPIFQHKPPNNSLFTEQSQEIELIDFQKYVQQ